MLRSLLWEGNSIAKIRCSLLHMARVWCKAKVESTYPHGYWILLRKYENCWFRIYDDWLLALKNGLDNFLVMFHGFDLLPVLKCVYIIHRDVVVAGVIISVIFTFASAIFDVSISADDLCFSNTIYRLGYGNLRIVTLLDLTCIYLTYGNTSLFESMLGWASNLWMARGY